MNFNNGTPTIVVLKEGTDKSQGKSQIISNINACLSIQDILKPTLGPLGSDILLSDQNNKTIITNDGATILKSLDIVHPACQTLVDISKSQDMEIGDGTTTVTLLACELMKESKQFLEEGINSNLIMKSYNMALKKAIELIKTELSVKIDTSNENEEALRDLLEKCAKTAMSSKLINNNSKFFVNMCVDAILTLDRQHLDLNNVGIKKVSGGSMEDSLFVKGVAFAKTFSYAGFEQQPKYFKNPKILSLNLELELKAERDNAEVRIEKVEEYQKIVDAEWKLIHDKLELIKNTGANIVLSKLPIGDLATQYFADHGIFCSGRVAPEDLNRVIKAVGGSIQTSVSDLKEEHLGTCGVFEEKQIGNERYNLFTECTNTKTCTLVLRGGANQVIEEVARSLNDALMIVKRSLQLNSIVIGGGAIEMAISKRLRDYAKTIKGKQQLMINAFAKALEIIPRQLCENAGLDSVELLNKLRMSHSVNQGKENAFVGINFQIENIADNYESFIWEPMSNKINSLQSAVEACNLILSIDETITNKQQSEEGGNIQGVRGQGMGM
ncbi:probable T-complex protein 1 subunit eta [Hanseniaspora guilliermondii]|uniref:T-complex protein 1 subunit eta n=1 Tax=Hanseniaspora guilliermondii TaxID=56406 RepID=A0A1L0AZB8_9ASCO|nr:probable T-complex protein 1 subunit eta [Hanseniaspora guilliermondii]